MTWMVRARAYVVGLAFVGIGVVALSTAESACTNDDEAVACKDIPDGGCPQNSGVSCEDPSCHQIYVCTGGGTWQFDYECPATDAMIAEPVPTPDGGTTDLFDAPAGDLGCPDLEEPDCSASTAASCGAGCCGCDDFFVCGSDGEWTYYGSCLDDGGVILVGNDAGKKKTPRLKHRPSSSDVSPP